MEKTTRFRGFFHKKQETGRVLGNTPGSLVFHLFTQEGCGGLGQCLVLLT